MNAECADAVWHAFKVQVYHMLVRFSLNNS
jgi:hypothetical protein